MDDHFDLREVPGAPLAEAPWYFKLGRFLVRRRIRGGARLLSEARRRGFLDRVAVYPVGDVQLRVPLWRPCNAWDADDVAGYEAQLMQELAATIRHMPGEVTLIDCGADIGMISTHLVSRCTNISTVIAFEPNAAAYAVLSDNLHALPVTTKACHAAVGSFRGRGKLVSPPLDASAHAMYIEEAPDGEIAVARIDDLELPPGKPCVIKIDVEGSEAAVVAGALRTIRDAGPVVVVFEAHPGVTRRTGEDPIVVMRALRAVRPDFTFDVDTTPVMRLTPTVPVFEQLPALGNYNVIARSHGT